MLFFSSWQTHNYFFNCLVLALVRLTFCKLVLFLIFLFYISGKILSLGSCDLFEGHFPVKILINSNSCPAVFTCFCRQVDKLVQENMELMRRLTAQEEALSYSNRQLQQQSAESQALGRQLEAALSDVAQQVSPSLLLTASLSLSEGIFSVVGLPSV